MTGIDFIITDNASKRLVEVLSAEAPGAALRITVEGGGCSGFQYNMIFDVTKNESDIFIEQAGAKVIIDDLSMGFLKGSALDFEETLGNSAFRVINPNASAKCGCGNSFAI